MLDNINLQNILFLDIETVPLYPSFNDAPEVIKQLWLKKEKNISREPIEPGEVYRQAGIYAEFGKIICVSCGFMTGEGKLRIKSFFGDDEKVLLTGFAETLNKFCSSPGKLLCAHNGKEFDFPYLGRRMIVNQITLPSVLDLAGKKPWEISHLDTMELWKFGDHKAYTSLLLLATILGIPTPKDDIDGSMVGEVYWKEKNLQRIAIYCQKDVLTVAQIMMRYKNMPLLKEGDIEIVTQEQL